MKISNWISTWTILGFLMLSACTSENENGKKLTHTEETSVINTAQLILGNWEINGALRSGKKTETLNGAFFNFYPDGRMKTNLLGTDEEANYELNDNSLLQRGVQDVSYQINQLDENHLTLTTSLRDVEFKLNLVKASPKINQQ